MKSAKEKPTIAFIANEVARRFDAVRMRTEDRLNDQYLMRVISEIVTEVLTTFEVPRRVWTVADLRAVKHDAHGHDFTVARISEMLVGRPPPLQSAILAELMATWLAGCPPALREPQMAQWMILVHDLRREIERRKFGPEGNPIK